MMAIRVKIVNSYVERSKLNPKPRIFNDGY